MPALSTDSSLVAVSHPCLSTTLASSLIASLSCSEKVETDNVESSMCSASRDLEESNQISISSSSLVAVSHPRLSTLASSSIASLSCSEKVETDDVESSMCSVSRDLEESNQFIIYGLETDWEIQAIAAHSVHNLQDEG